MFNLDMHSKAALKSGFFVLTPMHEPCWQEAAKWHTEFPLEC